MILTIKVQNLHCIEKGTGRPLLSVMFEQFEETLATRAERRSIESNKPTC
jgi:hypothetical protein